jgi:hypothetical protein
MISMATVVEMLELEEKDEDFDLLVAVRERESKEGWDTLLRETIAVLADRSCQGLWRSAIAIVYWASSSAPDMPVPKSEVIARLYWCLINHPESSEEDENLVWSATMNLKGVDYLSEWDPMKDPEVRRHLDAMG